MSLAIDPRLCRRACGATSRMSRHTSWHVGGPADVFFMPRDRRGSARPSCARCRPGTPLLWVGLGSNLLVRDGGIRGVVISHAGCARARSSARRAATSTPKPACPARASRASARKWDLGPAEFFAGIPGTLGGALAMNAGAFGGETWRHVASVETVDARAAGAARAMPASTGPATATSRRRRAQEWFLGARRCTSSGEIRVGERHARAAGAAPPDPADRASGAAARCSPIRPGDHAARLIEAAGLKGFRIGGAVVSTKHANFIINEGQRDARATSSS